MSRKVHPAECHPWRPRVTADGRCDPCYRKERPRPWIPAPCHPDRPVIAKGLCQKCYDRQRVKKPRAALATNCPHKDRVHAAFGLCHQCYSRQNAARNPEKVRERDRRWNLAHPGAAAARTRRSRLKHLDRRRTEDRERAKRAYAKDPAKFKERQWRVDLKRKYGVTVSGYNALLESQGGACAICETDDPRARTTHFKRFHVDHVAGTKRVRGLLCHSCNMALGLLRHDPAILSRAAEYLERTPAQKLPYGSSHDYYEALLDRQAGRCAICLDDNPRKRPDRERLFEQDHDHETGLIRGLLCGACNKGIGKFRNDPHLLRGAANYLGRH